MSIDQLNHEMLQRVFVQRIGSKAQFLACTSCTEEYYEKTLARTREVYNEVKFRQNLIFKSRVRETRNVSVREEMKKMMAQEQL